MRAEGLRALIELLGTEALGLEWSGGWELFDRSEAGMARAEKVREALPLLNDAVQPLMASVLGHLAPHPTSTPALVYSPERAAHFGAHAAVHLPWEGMLHTGRMVSAFHKALQAADVQCLNGCAASAVALEGRPSGRWSIGTPRGLLLSKSVAICTNGFAKGLLPEANVNPAPNRVLVVRPRTAPPKGAYHIEDGYLYFRTLPDGQVLFGGGRHFGVDLPPFPKRDQQAEARWDALLESAAERWLGAIESVSHRWTGWLGVGADREPLLGTTAPGLHHAVRMGGMGVAMGCGIGLQLAQTIATEAHPEPRR
jgi:glycine/D-amino acid oxidase-like deaminating enzyme